MASTILPLTGEENEAFYDVLSNEIKLLVNEYDDDTGRVPGKERLKTLPMLTGIEKRWLDICSQDVIKTVTGKEYPVLPEDGAYPACDLALTEKEAALCRRLLEKEERSVQEILKGHTTPYTGMLLVIARYGETLNNILKKL